jgi:hypothetical protein
MTDQDLVRTQIELLRQQNETLRTIAKHTRLQYVLTCVALVVLVVCGLVGLAGEISASTGMSAGAVILVGVLGLGVLAALIAYAARAEKEVRASTSASSQRFTV